MATRVFILQFLMKEFLAPFKILRPGQSSPSCSPIRWDEVTLLFRLPNSKFQKRFNGSKYVHLSPVKFKSENMKLVCKLHINIRNIQKFKVFKIHLLWSKDAKHYSNPLFNKNTCWFRAFKNKIDFANMDRKQCC